MEHVGNIIIAPPAVKNSFWHKAVIIVTEHTVQGTLGIVLNKPSNMSINDLGSQLNILLNVPGQVYVGGPINKHSLTMLHTPEWSCMNTLRINNSFCISSSNDMLHRLGDGDYPRQWRLFLGMCGWAPNQLASELNGLAPYKKETSWVTTSANHDLVFENDGPDQWCEALDQSAKEFAQNILT